MSRLRARTERWVEGSELPPVAALRELCERRSDTHPDDARDEPDGRQEKPRDAWIPK